LGGRGEEDGIGSGFRFGLGRGSRELTVKVIASGTGGSGIIGLTGLDEKVIIFGVGDILMLIESSILVGRMMDFGWVGGFEKGIKLVPKRKKTRPNWATTMQSLCPNLLHQSN
jgi:hypothetical protein